MAPLIYLNTPSFDCEAPINIPHLIEPHTHPLCVNTTDLRLCDAVATFLFEIADIHPTALTDFFDFERVEDFMLTREFEGLWRDVSLVILRGGKGVVVGFRASSTSNSCPFAIDAADKLDTPNSHLCWHLLTKSRMNQDGYWKAVYGARTACSDKHISSKAKLTDNVRNINYPLYMSQDPDDAAEALDVANSTARLIFHGLLGKKGMGKGCIITTVIAK